MKKLFFGFLGLTTLTILPVAAIASDLMVAAAMQRCTTNEECTLITNSCSDNCGFIPVNKINIQSLQSTYQQRCGKPMEANPQCNMNPPISAACINNRCTIDYAYMNNADKKDYQSGAYPVPEAPVPSQVPASAAPINDRTGFTAYEMPQGDVRQNSLGTIYVPQSAPVSGSNYVPVGPALAPAATPVQKPAPAVKKPNPAPPMPKSSATPAAPYEPMAKSNATPATTVPPAPSFATPSPADLTAPMAPPAAVAIPAPAPVPTATTTPRQIATPTDPIPSSAPDTIPEPRVPQEEPMLRGTSPETGNPNAPIAPSEYKSQTFVPPPGSTIPVAPEDPGAKPPEGTILLPPVPRGPEDSTEFQTKTIKDNNRDQ